jgi:hypothetical protein
MRRDLFFRLRPTGILKTSLGSIGGQAQAKAKAQRLNAEGFMGRAPTGQNERGQGTAAAIRKYTRRPYNSA